MRPTDRRSAVTDLSAPLAAQPSYSRVVTDYVTFGQHPDGTLVGIDLGASKWATSEDGVTWETLATASSTPVSGTVRQEIVFDGAGFMYVSAADGTAWRAPEWDFANWTDISVSSRPAGTTGRVGILVPHAGFLFYGNYNAAQVGDTPGAHVWRSEDRGATWTEVMASAAARHVHNIVPDPTDSTRIWAALGDANWEGNGLWVSEDTGATWRHVASNMYPIDIAFSPSRLVMEGDGAAKPHVVGFPLSMLSTGGHLLTVTPPPATWAGTGRGIRVTSEGHLFYISTAEGGATGTKDGFWLAKGPDFRRTVLLEDVTANVPAFYGRTYEIGPYLINYRSRMVRPTF